LREEEGVEEKMLGKNERCGMVLDFWCQDLGERGRKGIARARLGLLSLLDSCVPETCLLALDYSPRSHMFCINVENSSRRFLSLAIIFES
jgi:hypothetical protein